MHSMLGSGARREAAWARANTGALPIGLPTSFLLDARSSFDRTKTSPERRRPPPPNTIAALVFAPSFSFRWPLAVTSSLRLVLARSAPPANGQLNLSRG